MKNIRITHKGYDYIKVEYEKGGEIKEAEITGEGIEIIEVLCKALLKPFPKGYKFEEDN